MSNDSFSIFVQHKMHLLQKLYDSHFQFEEDHLEATIHFRFFCSKYYIHLYMQDFWKFLFQRLNDEAFAMNDGPWFNWSIWFNSRTEDTSCLWRVFKLISDGYQILSLKHQFESPPESMYKWFIRIICNYLWKMERFNLIHLIVIKDLFLSFSKIIDSFQ